MPKELHLTVHMIVCWNENGLSKVQNQQISWELMFSNLASTLRISCCKEVFKRLVFFILTTGRDNIHPFDPSNLLDILVNENSMGPWHCWFMTKGTRIFASKSGVLGVFDEMSVFHELTYVIIENGTKVSAGNLQNATCWVV